MIRRQIGYTMISRVGTLLVVLGVILWQQFDWQYWGLLLLAGIGLIAVDVFLKYRTP